MMAEPRHLAYLRVSGEELQDMMTARPDNHWYRVQLGIPEDAKFVRMAIDESEGRNELLLVFEHPSFLTSRNYSGWTLPALSHPMFESCIVSKDELERIALERLKDDDVPPVIVEGE